MKYENKTNEKKHVRYEKNGQYHWIWVKPGDTVDIPSGAGEAYGLSPSGIVGKATQAFKGKAGRKSVETKHSDKDKKKSTKESSDMESEEKEAKQSEEKEVVKSEEKSKGESKKESKEEGSEDDAVIKPAKK